jgi:hypothetical protein
MTNWRKYNGALIPDQPPHIEIDDSDSLIKKKISDNNVFFARWTSDFDCDKETNFWHVIQDTPLEINDYSPKTRNQIRRSLKKCNVKKVKKEEIIKFGYNSYYSAFQKYNTYLSPLSEDEFICSILLLGAEWEFWGIYDLNEMMIGYSQNKIVKDYCDYSIMKFHPDYLKSRPSEALIYTMNQYYLNERNFRYINDGARSISHDTNIQEFLIKKFKFRKAYCKLNIIYNSRIGFLVKFLYSFRLPLKLLNFGPFVKLNILLNQEKIRRSYEKRN